MHRRHRSRRVHTASLSSAIDRGSASSESKVSSRRRSDDRTQTRLVKKPRFTGDVVYSPVYGHVSAINSETYTLTLETHVFMPHAIIAPVDGIVKQIDTLGGTLLNGVFTAERDKEAILTVQIECLRSDRILHLTIVAKAHQATSRVLIPLVVKDVLIAGTPIGYAGGRFETRIRLPPTAVVSTHIGASVRGANNALATIYHSS